MPYIICSPKLKIDKNYVWAFNIGHIEIKNIINIWEIVPKNNEIDFFILETTDEISGSFTTQLDTKKFIKKNIYKQGGNIRKIGEKEWGNHPMF